MLIFALACVLGQKFFVRFLGELKKAKSLFETIWPLVVAIARLISLLPFFYGYGIKFIAYAKYGDNTVLIWSNAHFICNQRKVRCRHYLNPTKICPKSITPKISHFQCHWSKSVELCCDWLRDVWNFWCYKFLNHIFTCILL